MMLEVRVRRGRRTVAEQSVDSLLKSMLKIVDWAFRFYSCRKLCMAVAAHDLSADLIDWDVEFPSTGRTTSCKPSIRTHRFLSFAQSCYRKNPERERKLLKMS